MLMAYILLPAPSCTQLQDWGLSRAERLGHLVGLARLAFQTASEWRRINLAFLQQPGLPSPPPTSRLRGSPTVTEHYSCSCQSKGSWANIITNVTHIKSVPAPSPRHQAPPETLQHGRRQQIVACLGSPAQVHLGGSRSGGMLSQPAVAQASGVHGAGLQHVAQAVFGHTNPVDL